MIAIFINGCEALGCQGRLGGKPGARDEDPSRTANPSGPCVRVSVGQL